MKSAFPLSSSPMPPRIVHHHAPAKLNLALSVGPPDPHAGGLHRIASWMMTVDLFDDLTLTALEPGSLSRYAIVWHKDAKRRSEINWSITKDLAVRAHLALEKHVRRRLAVQMKLEKRIPVGGGLGGGSSDAAAMLRGLNALFDLRLSRDELASIGHGLGSDVPFLVHGGSAIVEGLGERIDLHTPHESPSLHAVVAFPDAQCATGRVYGLFDECGGAALRGELVRSLVTDNVARRSQDLFNDLAEPAMRAAPQLRDDLEALARLAERPAHVSGSGSSIFVVCDDDMHALALADSAERNLNLPAVAVRTITGAA
jgi:4-diphosphocytidyl-2-C-methyl-D-erythritol kinase